MAHGDVSVHLEMWWLISEAAFPGLTLATHATDRVTVFTIKSRGREGNLHLMQNIYDAVLFGYF